MLLDNARLNRVALALLGMQRHSWEQGVAMQAFYELGQMDVVVALAREAVYRTMPDGRTAAIGAMESATDSCAAGEALMAAARATGDERLCSGAAALLHWALDTAPRSPAGVLYHLMAGRQFWADSFYMLPPYLAAAGYCDAALKNLYGCWDVLYDADAGMMCHIWDEETKTFPRAAHWGTGNGWTMAALSRVIALLPPAYAADKKRLSAMAKALVDRVILYMNADGSYHDIIDDPATFREINLSQMLAYTIYRGMLEGWLDDGYRSIALTLRHAAQGSVDGWGFVQDVCGAPSFDKPGISPEAQAFHLMMENAAAHFEARQKKK